MKRIMLVAALGAVLAGPQAWANCEKIAYVDSVRAYAGTLNNFVFIREKGVNSPTFVMHTDSPRLVRGALAAHVNRTPVQIDALDPNTLCNAPSGGLFTNLGLLQSLIVAP